MSNNSGFLNGANAFIHRNFLRLLVSAYVVAAILPQPGLWLRDISFCRLEVFGEAIGLTMPLSLLAFLLFNAGLGVHVSKVCSLLKRPQLLMAGLAANVLIPTLFIIGSGPFLGLWPDADEAQTILLGLALVAAMPIAGSSTAWSQHADGDVALSLGLVLFSTLLSPLTTPLVLHVVKPLLDADYGEAIAAVGGSGTSLLLGLFVMVPAFVGVGVNCLVGEARLSGIRSAIKPVNSVCLLVLIWCNAAASLPETVAHPDADFLALVGLSVLGLCATTFAAGWGLGRLMRADESHQAALMFGLGMNNNGAGLVLASFLLASRPQVMLPIIVYNLGQHLVAGIASRLARSSLQ